MLVRYNTTAKGKKQKIANIYTRDEHGIRGDQIEPSAVSVTRRLQRSGFHAYVVGGAVRDLLLGKSPKDFDIATDARPRKIRRLFNNSRVIGKRFRLVHVYFQDQILEVSTFRSADSEHGKAVYGTMLEDARRRDFTANALYYDPAEEYLIDYVGGYEDIRNGRLNALIPVDESFPEDPVRMIRAVRYSCTTGFKMSPKICRGLRKYGSAIKDCPISRLTEELFKILESGASADVLERSQEFGILKFLLPEIVRRSSVPDNAGTFEVVVENLRNIDRGDEHGRPYSRGRMIAALVEPFLTITPEENMDPYLVSKGIFSQIKDVIRPLTPPNADVGKAARELMKKNNLRLPHARKRRRRR